MLAGRFAMAKTGQSTSAGRPAMVVGKVTMPAGQVPSFKTGAAILAGKVAMAKTGLTMCVGRVAMWVGRRSASVGRLAFFGGAH